MDAIQRGVLTLIKAAVLQQSFPLPEDFSLEQAYSLITRHHITAMAFEGARLCGIPRKDPTMGKLFAAYCRSLQISEGQLRELERVYAVFEQNHIDYMPLKGSIMKYLYPKPELRTMGDADILFRQEQEKQINQLLTDAGFALGGENDYHIEWVSDCLHMELHRNLLPKRKTLFNEYYSDPWHYACVQSGSRYAMSIEDEFLFLLVHFTKHYLGSGIGCRQAVDLWVYLMKHPDLNERLLREKMEQMKLCRFYDSVLELLNYWFEDGTDGERVELMTQYIFSGGSWGKRENALQTEMLRKGKNTTSRKQMRIKFYLHRLFPPRTAIMKGYPILKKAPLLLPFVWVVRIFDILLVKRNFGAKRKFFEAAGTEEKLDQRMQHFKNVGLEDCV